MGTIDEITKDMTWFPRSLYYSGNYEQLIHSILQIANEKYIPASLIYAVKNEIESLLVALSIEIWAAAQGYPVTISNLVEKIKQKYEVNADNPYINKDFWISLEWLSSLELSERRKVSQKFYELTFSFDAEKNYQTILHRTTVEDYAELLLIIQAVLIFEKTSCQENELIMPSKKKSLEEHLYKIVSQNKSIDIYLSQMSSEEYLFAKEALPAAFVEQIFSNRRTLSFQNLHVQVNIEKVSYTQGDTLFDELLNLSEELKINFLGDFNPDKFADCDAYADINLFLESINTGMLIVGKSGIGKSHLLKK